jgi:cytochrome c553
MPTPNKKGTTIMMSRLLLSTLILGLGTALPAAAVTGNASAGKAKSTVCASCHGPDGNSPTPAFPKLAGQNDDYLVHALKAYRDKSRVNAIMNGQAANLSDQDIADLAAYFASQSGLKYKR